MSVNGTARTNGAPKAEEFDVVIVGAGFGGIYLLHTLRALGYNVKVLEAGKWFGGIWWWNSYPGARVDTNVPFYEFAAKELWEDWNWTAKFPARDELVAYFEHVNKKWNLEKDILFDNAVVKADFDESSNTWTAVTDKGYVAKSPILLLATGFAAKTFTPKIQGLDTFKGQTYHTARWPKEGVDLKGKKVGVIGTGASGVQVIQEIANEVEHLTVFQRTANLAIPMRQEFYNDEKSIQKYNDAKKDFPAVFKRIRKTFAGFDYEFLDKSSSDDTPEERLALWEKLWQLGGFNPWLHNYKDVLENPLVNRAMYDFWVSKVRARLTGLDPELVENLAPLEPVNPWGTKRPSLEVHFYEVFHQNNVDLYNLKKNPVTEVTPKGVKLMSQEVDLDVLILATGFDAVTGSILQIDITGADGQKLVDKWAQGTYTKFGIATAGFPNLLFLYGPQAPTAFGIGPRVAEIQGEWVAGLLETMKREHYTKIEASRASEEKWRKITNDVTAKTLLVKGKSWYMGDNIPGKPREALNYMGGLSAYEDSIKACAAEGYEGFNLS